MIAACHIQKASLKSLACVDDGRNKMISIIFMKEGMRIKNKRME